MPTSYEVKVKFNSAGNNRNKNSHLHSTLCLLLYEGKLKHSNVENPTIFWEQEFLRGSANRKILASFLHHLRKTCYTAIQASRGWLHKAELKTLHWNRTASNIKYFREFIQRLQVTESFVSMMHFYESEKNPDHITSCRMDANCLSKNQKWTSCHSLDDLRYFCQTAKDCVLMETGAEGTFDGVWFGWRSGLSRSSNVLVVSS